MSNIPLSSLPVKWSYHLNDRVLILNSEDSNDAYTIALDTIKKLPHTHTASEITDFDAEVSSNSTVEANTTARHTHSNKTVLDNTQESYTTANKSKLDAINAISQADLEAWSNWSSYVTGSVYNAVKTKCALYNLSSPQSVPSWWVRVLLNTELFDNIWASVSWWDITLPAWTYYISWLVWISWTSSVILNYHITLWWMQNWQVGRAYNNSANSNSDWVYSPRTMFTISSPSVVALVVWSFSGTWVVVTNAYLDIIKIS